MNNKFKFPEHLDAQKVRGFVILQGGSTHPHEGWIDGRRYVLKCGSFSDKSSDEHVHNEVVADELLRAAGCLVPESKEYRADIGNGKLETLRLSRFIENGMNLQTAYMRGNSSQREKLVSQIVKTYPVVSFIDGTDTYQHDFLDNVLVDADYNLWFIDNGASFDFRARGSRKNWFWDRTDAMDEEHGYLAIRKGANDTLKLILRDVADAALVEAARYYDFMALFEALPKDYQRKPLRLFIQSIDAMVNGKQVTTTQKKENTMKQYEMTAADCEWLEDVSIQIAKAVRRINKFIDKGKADKTATSRTMANYANTIDIDRMHKLEGVDPSGRVTRLLAVCDDIANSEATGYKVMVLSSKWQRGAMSTQRPGKPGNVVFDDYAFSRKAFELAGGKVIEAAATAPNGNISVICGKVEDTVADAVVNAANEHLAAGSGICGAIFRKAGHAPLQAACDKVAPCPTGEARITPSFGITNAKYVIHAVGPRWFGGSRGEPQLLASCYRNLLQTAVDNGCKSVAVPSISTGIFGYPLDAAIEIAVREVKSFVATNPGIKVIFVIWDGDADGGKGTQAKYLKRISN